MALNNADVFKRFPVKQFKPITADGCIIKWGGEVLISGTNIAINYAQQVQRRRTLGNRDGQTFAVLYATQPAGSINIGRLFAETTSDIFNKPGWNACDIGVTIDVEFTTGALDCSVQGPTYRCKGCIVTQYSVSAEAEGLSVLDNVVIEFLQMEAIQPNGDVLAQEQAILDAALNNEINAAAQAVENAP